MDSQELSDKLQLDEFFALDRNYIILTNSGKPVFSWRGDMYVLSSVYATLYAMISKVQTYEFHHIDLNMKMGDEPQVDVRESTAPDHDNIIPMAGIKKKGMFSKLGTLLSKTKEEELCDLIGSDATEVDTQHKKQRMKGGLDMSLVAEVVEERLDASEYSLESAESMQYAKEGGEEELKVEVQVEPKEEEIK